jgi:putative addiction module component (TIGR02574 family)
MKPTASPPVDIAETKVASAFDSLGVERLSISERVVLVQMILDTISGPQSLPEHVKDLLDSRIDEDEQFPNDVVPWEVARQRVLDGLGQ